MGLADAIKVAAVPNESAILAEIHNFFSRYGPTFVELADGERSGSQRSTRVLQRAIKVHWFEVPHGYEGRC